MIPKPKKRKTDYKKKADRYFQELGRQVYSDQGCLICQSEYSCLHHFIPKSRSTALRYNFKNGIPVCVSCHRKFHSADSNKLAGHTTIIMGADWLHELEETAKQGVGAYYGNLWYKEQYEMLKALVEK